MFNEHEVVRARRQLSEKVPQGARGTILLIHEHPTRAYEAEFIDEEGSTIDVLTVTDSDITRDLET